MFSFWELSLVLPFVCAATSCKQQFALTLYLKDIYTFPLTSCQFIITTIIYPVTMRVVGAPEMISQPVTSVFTCSSLPSWTC